LIRHIIEKYFGNIGSFHKVFCSETSPMLLLFPRFFGAVQ